jgi:SAM-dependent methyltransferase
MLIDIVEPTSVVDVGCGIGAWLAEFKNHGVEDVLGLDSREMLAAQSVLGANETLATDLASLGELDGVFDLALCLEVAEHLPSASADDLVAFLTTAAPVIAFSAAVPGQGGVDHVNEQWPGYWRARFEARGYRQVDGLRSVLWNDARVAWWYRQNLFLYTSKDLVVPGISMVEDLVHPEQLRWCDYLLAHRVRLADVPMGSLMRAALGRVRRKVRGARRQT